MKDKIELNFKNIFEATGLVLLDVTFGTRELTFLIDSGANVNMIDIDLIKNKDDFKTVKGKYISLHGKRKIDKIEGNFRFNIDKFEYSDNFVGTDLTNLKTQIKRLYDIDIAGIIGSNFLRTKNVIINYEDCTMLMDAYPEEKESNNNNLKTEEK